MRSGTGFCFQAGLCTKPTVSRRSGGVVCSARISETSREGQAVDTRVLDNCRALVLDAAYRPLGVVNWHRAVALDVLKDVEVLEYYDCFVKTVYQDYPIPAVMRSEFIMKGLRNTLQISLSRKNVLRRDRHSCVYCGEKQDLTIDHVVPVSLGGGSNWENLVAACKTCNNNKGNKTLEQLGWKLRMQPKRPGRLDVHIRVDLPSQSPIEWQEYIGHLQTGYKHI